jgi:acyl-CoA reductase-like NAD-dependent aldehyde dehydrogenase
MDLQVARMKNLVGGEFVEAERDEWERVIDPASGEVIAEVPRCAEEDVDGAVEAASRAFEGWFETTPAERAEMLHRLADAAGARRGTGASVDPLEVREDDRPRVGVAQTKAIVEQHGGHLEIESEPGQGTYVRLGLPLRE